MPDRKAWLLACLVFATNLFTAYVSYKLGVQDTRREVMQLIDKKIHESEERMRKRNP